MCGGNNHEILFVSLSKAVCTLVDPRGVGVGLVEG